MGHMTFAAGMLCALVALLALVSGRDDLSTPFIAWAGFWLALSAHLWGPSR